jgi:hypothetical protein
LISALKQKETKLKVNKGGEIVKNKKEGKIYVLTPPV